MNKRFISIPLLIWCGTTLYASDRIIKGTILSEGGKEPLVGASVYILPEDLRKAGITQDKAGTVTDINGHFTLTVPDGITKIQCKYIGYDERTVSLAKDKDSYQVTLTNSARMLGDVVVTGYQTLERRKLSASIGQVEVSDAMVGASLSIDKALAGQVAGVQVTSTSGTPGAPARIRIRGTASLNGTQDPLWVLDGIPLEGTDIPAISSATDNDITNLKQSSIAGLSPNDIENITILKDAAATAIYGARAANGVIVITTKKGRAGKPVVNFNTKLTYSPTLDASRLNLLNSSEKVDLEMQLIQDGTAAYPNKGGVGAILNKYGLMDAFKTQGWNGLTDEAKNAINQLKTINTDWNDILFRSAFTQEYNASISGGNDKVTYYNSVGFSKENGNVPQVSMNRFTLVSKTSYQVNKMLKLGVSIFANRRKNRDFVSDTYGYSNPVYYARLANPYYQPFDANGNYVYDFDINTDSEPDEKRGFNIYEQRANSKREQITSSVNSIFNAELRIDDHLKFTSQVGVQWDQVRKEDYVGQATFYMRNLRENSRYYDSATKTYKYLLPEGGLHAVTNSTTSQITWKAQGEYSRVFNGMHDVQLMAGSEIRKNWYNSDYGAGYGYDPKTLTTKPIIFRNEADAKQYPLHTLSRSENAFASFYATGSYMLSGKYLIGGSVRMDGSDLFGVDKKYRYLPIYSVSGMWRASEEKFLQSQEWMDNLTLRLSYGLQGNIDKNTSPYLIGSYGNVSILPGSNETNITIDGAPNAKLRWEKTATYNIGLDFSVLKQAINLSIDYYYRKGTDLIGQRMLPLENGFSSMTINWASMENKGVEVNLQTRNITTRDFSWYTTLNFAYNQNKVLKVMTPASQTTPGLEGYPVGAIFALKTKGIDPKTGRILLEGKDGKAYTIEEMYKLKDEWGIGYYSSDVTPEEERNFYSYMGTSDAPYSGGFMNTFNYRNWELNINLAYNIGAHVRTSPTYSITSFDQGHNTNRDILDRWTLQNPNASMPGLLTADSAPADYTFLGDRSDIYRNLDIWVKRLSYIRLQNLRLSYRMPSGWMHKIGLKGATIAVEGQNLFVFGSSYKNYMDPESMSNLYATPIPKTFTFNVSLNF